MLKARRNSMDSLIIKVLKDFLISISTIFEKIYYSDNNLDKFIKV